MQLACLCDDQSKLSYDIELGNQSTAIHPVTCVASTRMFRYDACCANAELIAMMEIHSGTPGVRQRYLSQHRHTRESQRVAMVKSLATVRFGEFEFDPSSLDLRRNGARIHLQRIRWWPSGTSKVG